MLSFEGKAVQPPEGEIVIVVSKFNGSITERLLDGALARLRESRVNEQNITVCRVPGAFEIPLVASRYAEQSNILAIICLGAVIKGETPHDEHINRAVSLEIAKIGTENNKPVIFGLLTCNTVEQAVARSGGAAKSHDKAAGKNAYVGNKGYEAAEAALEMIDLLQQLPAVDHAAPFHEMTNLISKVLSSTVHLSTKDIYDSPFNFDDERDTSFLDYDDDDDDEEDEDDDDFDDDEDDDDEISNEEIREIIKNITQKCSEKEKDKKKKK